MTVDEQSYNSASRSSENAEHYVCSETIMFAPQSRARNPLLAAVPLLLALLELEVRVT